MFRSDRRKKPWGGVFYAAASLGLLYEAVPRLPRQASAWSETFALAWCGFALLVVAANLWYVLGADKERAVRREESSFAPLDAEARAPVATRSRERAGGRQPG